MNLATFTMEAETNVFEATDLAIFGHGKSTPYEPCRQAIHQELLGHATHFPGTKASPASSNEPVVARPGRRLFAARRTERI
jgi:hypothetical protein